MLRFLCHIFKLDYDVCESCKTLREQLQQTNEENKRLTDAIIDLVKPKPPEVLQERQRINDPIMQSSLFSRRRAEAERMDRAAAVIKAQSNNLGKPDNLVEVPKMNPSIVGVQQSIEELERELGVEEING